MSYSSNSVPQFCVFNQINSWPMNGKYLEQFITRSQNGDHSSRVATWKKPTTIWGPEGTVYTFINSYTEVYVLTTCPLFPKWWASVHHLLWFINSIFHFFSKDSDSFFCISHLGLHLCFVGVHRSVISLNLWWLYPDSVIPAEAAMGVHTAH